MAGLINGFVLSSLSELNQSAETIAASFNCPDDYNESFSEVINSLFLKRLA